MTDAAHTERRHDLQWYHCILPSAALHVLLVHAWVSYLPEITAGDGADTFTVPLPGIEIVTNWESPAKSETFPAIPESYDPFEESDETVQGPQIRLSEPHPASTQNTEIQHESVFSEDQPIEPQPNDAVHTQETQETTTNTDDRFTGTQSPNDPLPAQQNTGTGSFGSSATGEKIGNHGHEPSSQQVPDAGNAHSQSQADETEIWHNYTKSLSAHFKKYKHYPEMARKQRLTGTVIVSIEIHSDGSIDDVQIAQSSGSAMLDQAALQSVRRASPAPSFPRGVQAESRKVTIPYRFQITD